MEDNSTKILKIMAQNGLISELKKHIYCFQMFNGEYRIFNGIQIIDQKIQVCWSFIQPRHFLTYRNGKCIEEIMHNKLKLPSEKEIAIKIFQKE